MTQRASTELKGARLSTDFGRDYAMRTFDLSLPDLEALVGRFSRGARKGELRGSISWGIVTVGGWVSEFGGGGFVVRPGLRYGHALHGVNGDVLRGQPAGYSTADAIRATLSTSAATADPIQPKPRTEEPLTYDEAMDLFYSAQLAGCSAVGAAHVLAAAMNRQPDSYEADVLVRASTLLGRE